MEYIAHVDRAYKDALELRIAFLITTQHRWEIEAGTDKMFRKVINQCNVSLTPTGQCRLMLKRRHRSQTSMNSSSQ